MAVQESVTVQLVGTAAQSATTVETRPSPSSGSQVTSGVTQIQIGCITECFGTTTTNTSRSALTQQFLSYLISFEVGCGSSTTQPTPPTSESVVDQVACQVQAAQTAASQTQNASQSATTVQATDAAPASQPPAPPSVAQAQQGTWQLQIGCVFYCADTQQVQQASQSITIINVQAGAPDSNSGAVDVTDQIIWQVQIGCVAWCYDATQVQVVAGQSTVIVDESPAPPTPPAPAKPSPPNPTSDPAGPAQQTGALAGQSTATTSASPPVDGPPTAMTPPAPRVHLLRAVGSVGRSMPAWIAPVVTATHVRQATVRILLAGAVAAHLSGGAIARPQARRSLHSSARGHGSRPVPVAEALAAEPRVSDELPIIPLMLAAALALLALAAFWTQVRIKSER